MTKLLTIFLVYVEHNSPLYYNERQAILEYINTLKKYWMIEKKILIILTIAILMYLGTVLAEYIK